MLLAASGLAFYPLSRRVRDLTRVERASLLFAGLSMAGLLVAVTGARPPFGSMNTHVMTSLHLLDVFRSVYARFTEYLPLVMAPLLAAGCEALVTAIRGPETRGPRLRRACQAASAACAGVLGVLVVVVVPWPMWSGALFDGSGPLPAQRFSLPESATSVGKVLDAQDGEFAVAVLPMGSSSMTYLSWPSGGFVGIQPYSFLTGKNVILGDVGSPAATQLASVLTSGPARACATLNSLNVRDIVLDVSPNLAVDSWRAATGADVPTTRLALSRLPCLRLEHHFAGADVYLNDQWTPHRFYATSSSRVDATEAPLRYRKLLPGIYRVTLPADRQHDRLVVNTPSDEHWYVQGGTRLSDGELTTFRRPGSEHGTSVLAWNKAEAVFGLLLALNLMVTFAVVLGPRLMRLAAWGIRRLVRVRRPSDDPQSS
jgi:hypothetical protein